MTAMGIVTVVALTVSFAPWGLWLVAYVALAPWVLGLALGRTGWLTVWLATLTGLIFWAVNLYWLTWVTFLGYVAGAAYLSVYWLAAALALRSMLRRRWPAWIVLPVVWVALEFVRAHVLGFPWQFLAHSQYRQIWLIQIADLTGQYGLSFVVAMVNGALVDLALVGLGRRPRAPRWRVALGPVVVASVLVGLLIYGCCRVSQRTQSPGPAMAIVQRAIPTRLGEPSPSPEEESGAYIDDSLVLGPDDLDLLIWPETVLPIAMNRQAQQVALAKTIGPAQRGLIGALTNQDVSDVPDEFLGNWLWDFQRPRKTVGEHLVPFVTGLDCPLLAGGLTLHPVDDQGHQWVTRNSALWFEGQTTPARSYAKMHPVPFSERAPFGDTWPWLHRQLRQFAPPTMSPLDPGEEPTRFELNRGRDVWRVAAPICYEGTFARLCRQLVMQDGEKVVDVLANISNDGWFVRRARGRREVLSAEHSQHLVAYCFRAVENRVPVVRAVNTGISASIDSNGRIVAMLAGSDGLAEGSPIQAGVLLLSDSPAPAGVTSGPGVLVDSRVSRYSQIGDVFALAVMIAAMMMVGWVSIRTARTGRFGYED